MVYGTEKPLSKRGRVLSLIAAWIIVGIPTFIALWFWMGWWALLLLIPAAWASWDYLKTGDFFAQVDHAMSHHVRTDEEGKDRFGKSA